jgi:hypothetical protein
MEDILAIVFIFGGGTLIGLSFSPVGRAVAKRILGNTEAGETDPAILEELDRMRSELTEVQERLDFAERMLAQKREPGQIGAQSE